MRQNESAERRSACELLHDIGRSESRHDIGHASEQHLMRLADDPLGVRDFLQQQHDGCQEPPGRLVLGGETAIAVARSITPGRQGFSSGPKRYQRPEPVAESSITPTAFLPSPDDRADALDDMAGFLDRPPRAARARGSNLAGGLITLAGGLLLLVLLMRSF